MAQSYEYYGELQRQLRQDAKKSLRDVAQHLGWSIPYVSDIERGQRNPPSMPKIRQIAEFLGKPEFLPELVRLAIEYRGEVTVSAKSQNDLDALVALNRRIETEGISSEFLEKLRRLLNGNG